jgi:hypothetical protein
MVMINGINLGMCHFGTVNPMCPVHKWDKHQFT